MTDATTREMHRLLGELYDGSLSEEGFQQLEFHLRDDPECRELYLRASDVHAKLTQMYRQGMMVGAAGQAGATDLASTSFALPTDGKATVCELDGNRRGRATSGRHSWLQWMRSPRISAVSALAFGLSACLFGILLGQHAIDHQDNRPPADNRPPTAHHHPTLPFSSQPSRAIATFAAGLNARFRDGMAAGRRLEPGRLRLEQGVAEIVFDRGAVLVLKGPAELDLIDESSCFVLSGAVSAKVGPDANGFVMRTDALQVSELDAEFGVRTTANETTELHVFDGELRLVDVRHASHPAQLLTRGNALRFSKDASADPFAADPTAFVRREELARRKRWEEKQAYQRWQLYSRRWATDPAAILRYDFSPAEDGSIVNLIPSQEHLPISRQSVPRWLEGRWADKQTMLFDGRTDMLCVPDHDDLRLDGNFSLAVWIKLRSKPSCWNRIAGKGVGADRNYGLWMNEEAALLWQICPDEDPESAPEWDRSGVFSNPIALGRWVLAVGVVERRWMKIYIDGELHGSRIRQDDDGFAMSDAPLTIGYYGDVPGHDAYFSGEFDELLLLRRALSSEEIRELYEAGRPDWHFAPEDGDGDSSGRTARRADRGETVS